MIAWITASGRPAASQRRAEGASLTISPSTALFLPSLFSLHPRSARQNNNLYCQSVSRPVQHSQNCYWLRISLSALFTRRRHPRSCTLVRIAHSPPRQIAVTTVIILLPRNHFIITIEQDNFPPLSGICAVDHAAVLRCTAIVCTVSRYQDQLADLIVDHPVPLRARRTHTTSTHSGDNGSQAQPADP